MTTECNVLRWLDPKYARLVANACAQHDLEYHLASRELERGEKTSLQRLEVDLNWIAYAAMLSQQPIKTMFYGFFLILGGWYLWYDVDKLPKKLWRKAVAWVKECFA